MEKLNNQLKELTKKLLTDKKVDVIIGYTKGTIPMRESPYFAYSPEETKNLIWSGFCCNNLALYTIKQSGKIGIIAQGCITRNLVILIKENQIKRENLYIIGINSPGMLDRRKIQTIIPNEPIIEVIEQNNKVIIKSTKSEKIVKRNFLLRQNCYTCMHPNPVISDKIIGELDDRTQKGDLNNIAALWEKIDPTKRWNKFIENIQKCIRCYACRDVCPLCYCHTCFVDETMPQWCGKTQDLTDIATFHLLRALHCAGRCTDCGACESACPTGIKMRQFTMKIEKDIRELYNYEPGINLEHSLPMTTYRPNDPQKFIY